MFRFTVRLEICCLRYDRTEVSLRCCFASSAVLDHFSELQATLEE
jgi:hypothetical protein